MEVLNILKKSAVFILFLFFVLCIVGSVVAADNDTLTTDESNMIDKSDEASESDVSDEYDDTVTGTGCTTTIIQGYNNSSAISFRRDATNKKTVNVVSNSSIVKQYKDSSYFFHVLVSKDGWLVGNGGADNAVVNHNIESNALAMVNKNTITTANMNNIYKQESKLSVGHFVIKSPDGSYSLIIKNNKRVFKKSGKLTAGDYLIVPNSPTYFRSGRLTGITSESSMISSSRMLAARDRFGVNRREILTYYYKNNVVNSTVKVSVTNDNGKYVGRKTGQKIDNIRTNSRYISSSSIPVLDKSMNIAEVNFNIRKIKTVLTPVNVVSNGSNVLLSASVRDEFGNSVNSGFVSVLVDDKTIKYANGNVVYVNVVNGIVKYNTTLNNFWKKNSHSYYFRYYGKGNYESSLSGRASISIVNPVTVKTVNPQNITYGSTVNFITSVRYTQNALNVYGGKVFYKINGKTVKDSANKTMQLDVNGVTSFNYTFDNRYKAQTYNITTIYVNGVYRQEFTSYVTINKIATRITGENYGVKNNVLSFSGKLVDTEGKPVKYNSYLSLKINGKTIRNNDNTTKTFEIRDGVISVQFTLPYKYKVGSHVLSVVLPELKETLSLRNNYTIRIE